MPEQVPYATQEVIRQVAQRLKLFELFEYSEVLESLDALLSQRDDLLKACEEIAKGEGRFAESQLEHASNTIEDMKEIANAAIAKSKGEKDA